MPWELGDLEIGRTPQDPGLSKPTDPSLNDFDMPNQQRPPWETRPEPQDTDRPLNDFEMPGGKPRPPWETLPELQDGGPRQPRGGSDELWEVDIDVVYATQRSQDSAITSAQGDVSSLTKEMLELMDEAWLGDAAKAFCEKFGEWNAKGDGLFDRLEGFKTALGQIGDRYMEGHNAIGGKA